MAGSIHANIAADPRAIALLSSPLAISEAGFHALIGALQSREATPLKGARTAGRSGSVALIPVQGPLAVKDSWWSQFFGSSSYETIARDLITALADDEIKSVVLNIDSPGGDASGCGELAKLIYASRGKKPIVAYCAGSMCSAAYWIGSAADRVVADESAILGSIGVRSMMVDASAYLDAIGIKEYPIVSSQSPHKVLDAAKEEDRARAQETLTAIASVFIADVARNRGVPAATVERDFGQGGVLVGADAVRAKLADSTGNLDSLIAELNEPKPAASTVARAQKGKRMAIKAEEKNDMECASCKKAMSAEDQTYCTKCFNEEEDEEGEEAKSFAASVGAILGEQDKAKALGVLLALKSKADEADKLRAQLEEAEKVKAAAEIKATLDDAVRDGRVLPAKRAEMEALATEHGLGVLKAFLGATAKPAPEATKPAPDAPAPEQSKKAAATAGKRELTPEISKLLAATGLTPEKFAEAERRYWSTVNPVEEK